MKLIDKNKRGRVYVLALVLVALFVAMKLDAADKLRAWTSRHFAPPPPVEVRVIPIRERVSQTPVAPSAWIEAEKKRYLALLVQAKPDVVVLPYQIPSDTEAKGIDLPARMVMAYTTAQRFALDPKLRVADVEITARATGEPRHMTRDEALAFARSIGAATVVYGVAWHDGNGKMSVRVTRVAPTPGAEDRVATAFGVPISDSVTPELAFRKVVDRLMSELGVSAVPHPRPYTVSDSFFPEPPSGSGTSTADNPVAGLWTQQLVAALHRGEGFPGQARIYERTLAGLEFVHPDSPDHRLLTARALVQLQRRPAALEAIGMPRTAEELAFVEYLNGNAPQLAAAIEKIKRPLPKLLARLDLATISGAYGMDDSEVTKMAEQYARSAPSAWQPAVVWNVSLLDKWANRSPVELKQVMDVQFPVAGFGLEELLRGKLAAGVDRTRIASEVEGLSIEHVRKVIEQRGEQWCCTPAAGQPVPLQYLNLLSTLSEAMLLQQVERAHRYQGAVERALELADRLNETVLGGHPLLRQRTMLILFDLLSRDREPERRRARAERLYETAREVRQWETRNPDIVAGVYPYESAAARARNTGPANQTAYPNQSTFREDFPPTPGTLEASNAYSNAISFVKDVDVLKRTCAQGIFAMRPCFAWRSALVATGDPAGAKQAEEELVARRFQGSEYPRAIMQRLKHDAGELQEARALAERAVAAAPSRSRAYLDVAIINLELGEVERARKVLQDYPAFARGSTVNSITISNDANWVGNAFAYRGARREARPFYELSARQASGAQSAYYSQMALAYMDRRFGDAARTALASLQHYPGSGSAYPYLSLLFALGDSKTAWAGVREAMNRYSETAAWYAAPVGFRIDQADAKAIGAWVAQASQLPPRIAGYSEDAPVTALGVAIHALAVDRDAASLDALHAIRSEVPKLRPPPTSFVRDGRLPAPGAPLRLDFMDTFLAGYTFLKRKNYEAALQAFERWPELNRNPGIESAFSSALPYYAYAAAKTGKGAAFAEKVLDRYEKPLRYTPLDEPPHYLSRFELVLARAVLAAHGGDHAQAMKHLERAKALNQPTGGRFFFPDYTLIEIAEMLGGDSGRREYLDFAVAVAKKHQVTEPWVSWSYTFEARHGVNPADRAKAYAIGRYLDPQSERLRGIDAAVVKKADEWLASNKPFPTTVTRAATKSL